jgi:stage V sporulation protein G
VAREGEKMEITEVKIFPVNEEKLKAYVTIVLDQCFVVRDLKIINGSTGLFVAMPSKKRADGTYKDVAHPLNKSTRMVMEKTILEAYLVEIKKGPSAPTHHEEDPFQERAGNE